MVRGPAIRSSRSKQRYWLAMLPLTGSSTVDAVTSGVICVIHNLMVNTSGLQHFSLQRPALVFVCLAVASAHEQFQSIGDCMCTPGIACRPAIAHHVLKYSCWNGVFCMSTALYPSSSLVGVPNADVSPYALRHELTTY